MPKGSVAAPTARRGTQPLDTAGSEHEASLVVAD